MPSGIITEESLSKEGVENENEYAPEELNTLEELPSEDKIETDINVAGADASISPLDPDFLLLALPFALAVDVLDVVLEIAGLFIVIPKIFGIAIDFVVLIILGGWLYWRTKKVAQSKRDYVAKLRGSLQKGVKRLSKLQKLGKVSPKVLDRYIRLYGKQMGKMGRAIARATTKPLTRTLIRGGLTFLGEILPFLIGIIPFWTIMVILSLREDSYYESDIIT